MSENQHSILPSYFVERYYLYELLLDEFAIDASCLDAQLGYSAI